jgi:hypothetical protein
MSALEGELSNLQNSYLRLAAAANDPMLPAELVQRRAATSASGAEATQQLSRLRQQQEARDHELATKMQQIFDSGVLETRTRPKRPSLSTWLRHSFVDGELHLLLFPLVDACGQSALKKSRKDNATSSGSGHFVPGTATPTMQTLADMRALLRSSFG